MTALRTPLCPCGRALGSETEFGAGLCSGCLAGGRPCARCGQPAVVAWQVEADGVLGAEPRCADCGGKRRAA